MIGSYLDVKLKRLLQAHSLYPKVKNQKNNKYRKKEKHKTKNLKNWNKAVVETNQ